MITLTDIADGTINVELPDDLMFANEFSSPSVRQTTTRTIGGKLVYSRGQMYKGRKLQFNGGDGQDAWIARADLLKLRAMVDRVTGVYMLQFDATNYKCIFDYENDPLIATPVLDCSNPDDSAFYHLEINLLTVE